MHNETTSNTIYVKETSFVDDLILLTLPLQYRQKSPLAAIC